MSKPEYVQRYLSLLESDAYRNATFAERAELLAAVPDPPPDRAVEEVDRWSAEAGWELLPEHNPRDRARDQLADAGEVVQRQFRSDQERIAELEELVENLEAREQELYSRGRRIERERGEALDAAKSLAAIAEGFLRDAVAEQGGEKP